MRTENREEKSKREKEIRKGKETRSKITLFKFMEGSHRKK